VVAQLVPLQESSLALVGTLLIVPLSSAASSEASLGAAETEATALTAPSIASATAVSVGQGLSGQPQDGELGGLGEERPAKPEDAQPVVEAPAGAAWKRFILRTDEAIERFDRANPELFPPAPPRSAAPETQPDGGHSAIPVPARPEVPPAQDSTTREDRRLEVLDAAIEQWHAPVLVALEGCICRVGETHQESKGMRIGLVGFTYPTRTGHEERFELDIAAALALAATVAGAIGVPAVGRRARTLPFRTGPRGWPALSCSRTRGWLVHPPNNR
jgi:hypothetical protein